MIEIKKWIMTLPFWAMFVAEKIVKGEEVTDEIIKQAYQYFLEDSDLKEKRAKREEIDLQIIEVKDSTLIEDLALLEVNQVKNVNALADSQMIEFSPNMTVIYGANGSGKTGYIRLFNNVFNSRGDKDILPNIFGGQSKQNPTCCFKFTSNEIEYDLKYPEDKTKEEFLYYSVFDNASARVHLDKENELFFTPKGFELFGKLIDSYSKILALLKEDIKRNTPENQYKMHFTVDSEIKQIVDKLDASTNIEKIKTLAEFNDADSEELKILETKKGELLALNIDSKVAELKKIISSLSSFKEKLIVIQNSLSKDNLDIIEADVKDLKQKEELTKQSGIDKFKTDFIKCIGNKEWKQFIESAYNFAKLQNGDPDKLYPLDDDYCLFCMQPLNKEAQTLIKNYWAFLSSTVEEEAKKSLQKIKNHKLNLEKIDTKLLPEDSILVQWFNEKEANIVTEFNREIDDAKKQIDLLIENLNHKNWIQTINSKGFDLGQIDGYNNEIKVQIKELQEQNPGDEIKKIDQQIASLKSKSLLKSLLPSIVEFIDKHKWAKNAASKSSSLNSKNITAKQSELFNVFITENYKKILM